MIIVILMDYVYNPFCQAGAPANLSVVEVSMGHSQSEKKNNHERIVRTAAKRLREKGLEAVAIADVMKEVGLTVGGFYKHFESRDDLVIEALRAATSPWFFVIIVTDVRAAEQLPAVTVTGRATPSPTPPGDTVSRDWVERSPEVHWPTPMFNKAAEIFTHNQIVINASCETVWNHLVHAELWPHWCPYSGKVTISGGSQVLQQNTRFTWVSSDLPQETGVFSGIPADRVDGLVIECAPPNRLGWRSFGRQWTIHGPLVSSYHNWYIKPMGAKKCVVTFEEVATGVAARYARGAYPEYVHLTHDHWLEGLKRISEARG